MCSEVLFGREQVWLDVENHQKQTLGSENP